MRCRRRRRGLSVAATAAAVMATVMARVTVSAAGGESNQCMWLVGERVCFTEVENIRPGVRGGRWARPLSQPARGAT